ncbi:DUF4391 domain-containing protein [Phocaeicola vulgatus]|jgi:hypothetical protein|uniref:DUF4391 family protein n=1 Tax=Phocaeicola vulgatus TaxID=821 RepID=A0A412QS96_PHOVU|nr:DUF4391 domain-containing protein [Phocaeicola vulgatus]MCG0154586.1 DUF4391 domain-containing protein [Phocaeicola vulgatus]MCG0328205.1 DUF4391 domain-containing protein [Phocaeicola vulgatus]MCG0332077.1 DUF4391 domain-containing protein [Phocaeicola vulgatus]MDB0987986.1 DUF4391 domain-containing protein [Phocaeicola vulgatus]MDB1009837.1 DUF4391 domain-containing protein [Phocaeicola vulgatus]
MYNLPQSTIVNRVIPKKTFVNQLGANTRMKDHFTNDVVRVEWLAKLAPSTINVADGKEVHEITIFLVPIKDENCPDDIFSFIDGMIPRHTIFILRWGDMTCLHLNYKEWMESSTNTDKTFRIAKTYRSQWIKDTEINLSIEGLTMDAIYEALVRQVAGERIIIQSESLREDVEKSTQREMLLKEIEILKRKEAKERQPQKKFVLHQQRIALELEISKE